MTSISSYVEGLIEDLITKGAIKTIAIEAAFRSVQRHLLLESFQLSRANKQELVIVSDKMEQEIWRTIYSDSSLVTRFKQTAASSSSSEPSLMARMLEQLELRPGLNILEIGLGTGYNAALLAEIVGAQSLVTSLDIQADVVEQTHRLLKKAGYSEIGVVCCDGLKGFSPKAPYDRIIATVGCMDLSPYWIDQLDTVGLILFPLHHAGWTPLLKVNKSEENLITGSIVGISGFMPIDTVDSKVKIWPCRPDIQPVLTQMERLPLFDDLEELHSSKSLVWASFPKDFYYFLSIKDLRAFFKCKPPGYGLYDNSSGIVFISPSNKCTFLSGDMGLYNALKSIYREWKNIKMPAMGDYNISFVPISQKKRNNNYVSLIRRSFFDQVISIR
ncbi:methyltransferase domain-containing protein [Adonisia turfae]|uniref:Protein-L-isoaspartate O-methyltransferase n=1 Tax=Adonisia turfae CCMR0081 TaxID=2292702 RepID=A0A6M0RE44_9CYAN|nr:methyltransferase domain-containing protein [Adonisia turfae]NEZ54548.1 methyltransferase domain-containing protein [Adonisia turfae CCMR0081]